MDFGMNCSECGNPTNPNTARDAKTLLPLPKGYPFPVPGASALPTIKLLCNLCSEMKSIQKNQEEQQTNKEKEEKGQQDQDGSSKSHVCGVCGVSTYRERLRALPIEKFKFLATEKKGGSMSLTVSGNRCVATCLDCSETLWIQDDEYNKMRMPLDKRNFNWVARPPPAKASPLWSLARLPNGKLVVPRPTEHILIDVKKSLMDDEDEGVPASPPSSLGDTPPIPSKRQRRMEIDEDRPPIHFMEEPLPRLETQSLGEYNIPLDFPTNTNFNFSPSTGQVLDEPRSFPRE